MIDPRPLKVKALELAIKSIKHAITPAAANRIFKTWIIFKNHPQFKQAIREKKLNFKQRTQLINI